MSTPNSSLVSLHFTLGHGHADCRTRGSRTRTYRAQITRFQLLLYVLLCSLAIGFGAVTAFDLIIKQLMTQKRMNILIPVANVFKR